MSRKTRLKLIALFFASLPFDLNLIWSLTGVGWLYWLSRFLGSIEQLIIGMILTFFPKVVQKWFEVKADIRVAILLIVLGIYFLSRGVETSYFLGKRWLDECQNIFECLR